MTKTTKIAAAKTVAKKTPAKKTPAKTTAKKTVAVAAAPAVKKALKVAPKAAKPLVKPVQAVANAPTLKVDAKAIAEGIKLTLNELAVLKSLNTSEFRESDKPGAPVPSASLPLTLTETGIAPKSIPGLLASLNKKSMLTTAKVQGATLVSLTQQGVKLAATA